MTAQILFVTGKGGVGKTSISTMLGLNFAKNGRKTLIVQTYGAQSISDFFGKPPATYAPQQLQNNLFTLSITAEEAIEEYALQQLKFKRLYRLNFENRFAKPLINGAPGLHDAVHLGKIYDLAEREKWPQIIVDAPATGHALSMLRSAKTMMELTKVGPMYTSNQIVHQVFSDPQRTRILLVTLLEHLPVQESISLWKQLGVELQAQCQSIYCNKVLQPPPLGSVDVAPDWARVAQKLKKRFSLQQEMLQKLKELPLRQHHIPILSPDLHSWENTLVQP